MKKLPILFLLVAGCSTTSLTDSWQSPNLHRKDMDKVLVVAATSNPTYRVLFERSFVQALKDKNIGATASIDVIGNSNPTREAVMAYLKKSDARYVSVTRYGGSEITQEVIPGHATNYVVGGYHPTLSGYWDANVVTIQQESYVETTTTVTLTTSMYDVATEELVWAGRSKSFEMGSIAYGATDLARLMVGAIKN
jgi:hypothetical protein